MYSSDERKNKLKLYWKCIHVTMTLFTYVDVRYKEKNEGSLFAKDSSFDKFLRKQELRGPLGLPVK